MTKIVITAAGKGTRLLPFSMEMPKEMKLLGKNLSKIKQKIKNHNNIGIKVTSQKKLI